MNLKAGIVITTRNRGQDIKRLFSRLEERHNWAKYPILVHDDASDNVSENYWERLSIKSILFIRNPRRYGLILSRNISNASAPFDFIFSLDDDSCFVDVDGPDQAVEYLIKHPKVAALSFPLVDSFNPSPIKSYSPYLCFSYIGCAHLIRKDVFIQLGGYRSDFIHQGEEPELCSRIWAAGYEVHAFPACRVYHWVSPTARNYQRMGFYGPRNRVWTHILHTPLSLLPTEIARAFGSYLKLSIKTKIPLVHLRGLVSGIQQGILTWHERQALPMDLYRYLESLPVSAKTPNDTTNLENYKADALT
ncbi:glycosyltransferase family 2 protein [Coleofasciculus sp.]|uniref:glycosyltransferase family 2 protein n=1 Tax=Coleofasciculus sp. TaxID=3100458 RepID=UPI0039F879B1